MSNLVAYKQQQIERGRNEGNQYSVGINIQIKHKNTLNGNEGHFVEIQLR